MAKKNEGIKNIKYGEIHFYYPFKFDNKLSYDEICKRIDNSTLMFTEELYKRTMDSLGKKVAETYKDIEKSKERIGDNSFKIKMGEYQKYAAMEDTEQDENNDNIIMEIGGSESSIKLYFKDGDLEAFKSRFKRLCKEQETASQYYGKRYTEGYQFFLLLPLKLTLINGENVWLYPLLYVFQNKTAILKMEVPLININPEILYSNNYNELIKEVINRWNIDGYTPVSSFDEIKRFYFRSIKNTVNSTLLEYVDTFKNIILVDYDEMPKELGSMSKLVKENLFRIVCAPVPLRENTSYEKDAIKYIEEYSLGRHGVDYIVKSTGGCLSIIDQSILDYSCGEYKNQVGIERLDINDEYHIYNQLAGEISLNAEFALMIIILKKINEENDYFNKAMHSKEFSETQKEYNENLIFIAALQEYCYGSASEQIIEFEKRMPYYIQHDLMEQKKEAINNILQQEEMDKNEKFQNFIAAGGLMLTLIFGLPSIQESLLIARNMCWYISRDIPYITLDNCSVILWVILNLFIAYKLYFKNIIQYFRKKSKEKLISNEG